MTTDSNKFCENNTTVFLFFWGLEIFKKKQFEIFQMKYFKLTSLLVAKRAQFDIYLCYIRWTNCVYVTDGWMLC